MYSRVQVFMRFISNISIRNKLELVDFLRKHDFGKYIALGLYFLGRLRLRRMGYGMHDITTFAAKWSNSERGIKAAKKSVKRAIVLLQSARKLDCQKFERAIVLKPHKRDERGIILLSFEEEVGRLASLRAYGEIERRYKILFMPSWKGVISEDLAMFSGLASQPFGILPSYLGVEKEMCLALSPRARYYPFHAASWVNGAKYRIEWTENRQIDLLSVGNFSSSKRHWLLFKAIAEMPSNAKATIVGVPLGGGTLESIRTQARLFGVEDRITLIENPEQKRLRMLFATSGLFCAFSQREGSFIAVAEALMANTPVVAFDGAEFGTKGYINKQTGFLIEQGQGLGLRIADCLENARKVRPGEWAINNISAEKNVLKLEEMLRKDAINDGETWTEGILPFYSERLSFHYFDLPKARETLKEAIVELESFGMFLSVR